MCSQMKLKICKNMRAATWTNIKKYNVVGNHAYSQKLALTFKTYYYIKISSDLGFVELLCGLECYNGSSLILLPARLTQLKYTKVTYETSELAKLATNAISSYSCTYFYDAMSQMISPSLDTTHFNFRR